MAAITPITPRAVIRLWQTPPITAYSARDTLGVSPASFYGLDAGRYGYGLLSPLGLDNFIDGSRASFTQLATITRTDSFSMIQEENGIGQWSAVYSYNAERPSTQDSQIVRSLANKVMFASVYIDLTGDDSDAAGEPAVPEPWFGGSLWRDPEGRAPNVNPASYTQPEWAYRGMVGPVNAIPLERDGPRGRLLLSGFCSLGWLDGVIHENHIATGLDTPIGIWNDLTDILRENCELEVGGRAVPTDVGRYLIRAAFDSNATTYLRAAGQSGVRAAPGTQSVLKTFQRYAEEADLLFNGLTPVIHFHRPRTADGGAPITIFRPHHYHKAKNETERPKANRILVYHNDSVDKFLISEWIDESSIAEWGVISDSIQSVAPQAISADDDIGTEAKVETMQAQAAAHARRSSESATGAADLIYTEGARWFRDWRLGDVVQIDDGSRVSADLIVRRVSCQISGDGSFSFTPGFGAQSDVVAVIGRNVQIQTSTQQERETIRLRKDVEDLKQHAHEADIHLANKQLEAPPASVVEPLPSLRAYNITGDRNGIIWLTPIIESDDRDYEDSDYVPTAYAFNEAAVLGATDPNRNDAQFQTTNILQAVPERNVTLLAADRRTGLDYVDGVLYSVDKIDATSAQNPDRWIVSSYDLSSSDVGRGVRISDVRVHSDGALNGASVIDGVLYSTAFPLTDLDIVIPQEWTGGWFVAARSVTSGAVVNVPVPQPTTNKVYYPGVWLGFRRTTYRGGRLSRGVIDIFGPTCIATNERDGVRRMWVGFTRTRESGGNLSPNVGIADQRRQAFFQCYEFRGDSWVRNSEGDGVAQAPTVGTGLVWNTNPVSAWHNGLGSIYYIGGNGTIQIANVLDEQSPGLEWDDEPYEFGLPIGTDGTSEPQLLGSVSATETAPDPAGARPITYEIIATTRPGVQINATTGSLLYVGSAVGVGDDDIRVTVAASVGRFGRRFATSIRTVVEVTPGGPITRQPDMRIVPYRNKTFSFNRPNANIPYLSPLAFYIINVPDGVAPAVNISDLSAGTGSEMAARTLAATGSVTIDRAPVNSTSGYNYTFIFRDDNPSEIGNELSFAVVATAGTQTDTEYFTFNMASDPPNRRIRFYSPNDIWRLSADNYAEADVTATDRATIGGISSFFWYVRSAIGRNNTDDVEVSIERVLSGGTDEADWSVDDFAIDTTPFETLSFYQRLIIPVGELRGAGRIVLRYVATETLSEGIHEIMIRCQGRDRGIIVNDVGSPAFFTVVVNTSPAEPPRVIQSDYQLSLKVGATQTINVSSAFAPTDAPIARYSLPLLNTPNIVSIVQTPGGQGTQRLDWQRYDITALNIGATTITSTATDTAGRVSEGWRVFVDVVDDAAPVWNSLVWDRSVAAGAASGTRVGAPITATGENVTYNLLPGRGSPQFTINETTGQITLARQAPTAAADFTLIVRATSNGNSRATANATVNIIVLAPAAVKAIVNTGWVGGTTIILKVGDTANVDYTDAWISDQPTPIYGFLSADTSIATVSGADAVATITAVAEGTTTITGTRTDSGEVADAVSVTVIVIPTAAVSRPSILSWYRLVGGVAQPVTAVAAFIREDAPLARAFADSLFLAGSEIGDRTISLTSPVGGDNIRVGLAADTSTITDRAGASITAREVSLFLGAVGLDFEDEDDRQQRWRVRADAPEYTDTDATPDVIWRQAQSDLGVNVTLSDRNEPPVLNTSFSVADQTIEVGTSTTLSFSGAATDPEGDAIFYAAASGNTTTATVSFSANTLTINALAVGTSTITWTFQSANSPVSMGGTFNVTVEAALRVNTTVQFDEATLTYRLPSLAAGPTALTPNTTARAEAASPAIAGAITYSLSGRDAALYTIDSATGQITLTGSSPAAGTTHNLIKTATSAQTATARSGSASQTIIVDFRIARAPQFPTDTTSFNLPALTSGASPNAPYLLGRVQADEPATYTLVTAVESWSVDAVSGQIYWSGTAADRTLTFPTRRLPGSQVGNGWTLTVRATNSAGSATIQVLVTVKAVVEIITSPVQFNLPAETSQPIDTRSQYQPRITVNTIRGFPSIPNVTLTGDRAADFQLGTPTVRQSGRDTSYTYSITYIGDDLSVSSTPADNTFNVGVSVSVAENGTCLGATATDTITVTVIPPPPTINGLVNGTLNGTIPVGADVGYVLDLIPSATKPAGATQTWVIEQLNIPFYSFTVDSTTRRITLSRADEPVSTDFVSTITGRITVTNTLDGASSSATANLSLAITSAYEPPTVNADWNPGANWTKGADGSWSGTVARGTPQTINITSDTSGTGPFTIQSGLTAEYRNTSLPTPPTAYSVSRSDGSFTITASPTTTGSGTLYLYMSDGTTEERLVFHIQVSATATATATTAVWYQDSGATYAPISNRGVTLNFPEGSSSNVSFNIYATYTQIQNRTNATLAEPTLAGFDIVAQTLQRRTLTINSQSVIVDAWTIEVSPASFDFETQSVYNLTAVLNVPEYTSGANTYAAAHKPLAITLNIANVNEPPARTAIATPADFALRKQGAIVQFSLNGFWEDPEGRSLSYRLTQSVVGATGGQSTTPSDYLSAAVVGTDFQCSAGSGATVTPTGVSILFSVESFDGTNYSTPMTFSCTSVHSRALEDSAFAWQSGLPARLEWQVAENIAVPYLLRSDIYATSTVVDATAQAGAIAYTLEDAKWWPVRNTDYQWANNAPSLSGGGILTVDMTNAFEIAGPEAAMKDFTISGDVTNSAVGTISISGKSFTLTAGAVTTQQTSTFIIYAHSGGFTANYVGSLTVTPATAGIAVNAGYTDAAVSLRASATTNVIVATAFTATPTGTTWNLSASSSNTAVAAVSVNDATKTLTITAGTSAIAGATATITYTATLGAMTASRTIAFTVAAEPVLERLDAGYTNIAFLENRLYASYAASGGTRRVLRPYNITTGAAELGSSLRTSSISIHAISEGITGQTLATWGYVGNRGDIRLFRYNATAAPVLNNQQTADGTIGDNANIIDAASLGSAQHPTLLIIGSTTGTTYNKDESGTVYYTTDTSPGIFSTNFSLTALTGALSTGSAVCADDTNFWVAQKGTANWELKAGTSSNYAADSSKDYTIPTSEVPLASRITSATIVNNEIWLVVHPTPSAISTTRPNIVKVAKP